MPGGSWRVLGRRCGVGKRRCFTRIHAPATDARDLGIDLAPIAHCVIAPGLVAGPGRCVGVHEEAFALRARRLCRHRWGCALAGLRIERRAGRWHSRATGHGTRGADWRRCAALRATGLRPGKWADGASTQPHTKRNDSHHDDPTALNDAQANRRQRTNPSYIRPACQRESGQPVLACLQGLCSLGRPLQGRQVRRRVREHRGWK
jgi:hypothetical protein